MACQSTKSDQNREPSHPEYYTATYCYHVLSYLWANPIYQFLKPPEVVVDNVSGCMCQRTSSLPKTRSRLAKTKTTAMKISHHLYQVNCNRVSGPVIVRTLPKNCGSTKTLQLLATTITVNRRMSQSHLMMMHQPRVSM